MILLIFGIYAIATGSLRIAANYGLKGKPAQIGGVLCVAFAFGFGVPGQFGSPRMSLHELNFVLIGWLFQFFVLLLVLGMVMHRFGNAYLGEFQDVAAGNLGSLRARLRRRGNLVYKKDVEGRTLLHRASQWPRADLVELLLANKAEINARTPQGETPLHIAAGRGYAEALRLLLANNADVNARTTNGETPLHSAALTGCPAAVELLLNSGSPVDPADTNGQTPLHFAAVFGGKAAAEILLRRGACAQAKANNGLTPFQLALKNQRMEVADLLREHHGAGEGKRFK